MWYPVSDLDTLQISWDAEDGEFYTILIYDISAPNAEHPSNSPYLHFAKVNIPQNNIDDGIVLMEYQPPKPMSNSGDHTYIIALYRQNKMFRNTNLEKSRANFNISKFIRLHELEYIEEKTLIVDSNTYNFYLMPDNAQITYNSDHRLIKPNSLLTEAEQNFCSCVIDVADRQPGACNLEQAWFERRDGSVCYNPFKVCAKSTGTSTRMCPIYYDYDRMTDSELISFANLHNISVPQDYNSTKRIS